MKNAILLGLCSLLVALVIVHPASAHVLKTDGTIGAVLHIEPDDNPTAGVEITYQLAFADTTNKFQLSQCDCSVSIYQDGKALDKSPLTVSGSLASVDTYTFATAGVYTMVISGMPKPGDSFQPFSLSYIVRAEANKQLSTQPFPLTLGIGFALMTVLLLLAAAKADATMK